MASKKKSGKKKPAAPRLKGDFYPAIRPYSSGFLRVSPVHEIYYEESGNPLGKPVVFLHGGPGGGTDPKMRRFFNPKRYRIVLFDQRGCGKSKPSASLVDNTTWHLVADVEAIREHLKIDRWQVFGGSWGSTLALAYAQKHPERCTELVLRGIFLLRRFELDWFYQNDLGAAAMFPDLFEQYLEPLSAEERRDCMQSYYRRLTSENRATLLEAARAWSIWEGALSYMKQNADYVKRFGDATFAAAFARIECHYFVNGGFLERPNQLLEDVPKIRHIPAVIVQGRFDVVCPARSAWDLHKAWPEADLRIVPDAGHAAFEPSIARELVLATDRFAR
ncbi:MAG TPA: prolyl aminopeptidase [Steroidobacteraceae bacterium]|jgi:proline iminopeptidase|nr:prolyl aminopeptidase [Steroidobacteraceae bacterium]